MFCQYFFPSLFTNKFYLNIQKSCLVLHHLHKFDIFMVFNYWCLCIHVVLFRRKLCKNEKKVYGLLICYRNEMTVVAAEWLHISRSGFV